MTRHNHTPNRLYGRATILCAALATAVIVLSACAQKKQYTWADRFPQDDCNPRTAKAKEELGGCPRLADPQHPTLQEKREFVEYMNKKNAIEGTYAGDYYPPGCWTWSIDSRTGDTTSGPTGMKGCDKDNLEKKLRNFKIP
ncbi:MAG: hypothetical protein ACRD11_11015 [Terriglobia bacterium]